MSCIVHLFISICRTPISKWHRSWSSTAWKQPSSSLGRASFAPAMLSLGEGLNARRGYEYKPILCVWDKMEIPQNGNVNQWRKRWFTIEFLVNTLWDVSNCRPWRLLTKASWKHRPGLHRLQKNRKLKGFSKKTAGMFLFWKKNWKL